MLVKKIRVANNTSHGDRFRCMFCGGVQCKRCGPEAYLNCANVALKEIHSSWISNSLVAMARPTNLNGAMIQDMVDKGISAVFNLTVRGEHPFCGRKEGLVERCGFSYDPELLMAKGIKHFNYSWPDMTIPTLNQALNIVQIAITEITSGGKIAVHCHAGYGRTGIIIACVLIAKDGLRASEVIDYIRSQRPGSVQTSAQVDFVHHFERYYAQLLNSYDTPLMYQDLDVKMSARDITHATLDQEHTLQPIEKINLQHVHKCVDITCQIILNCLPLRFYTLHRAFAGLTLDDVATNNAVIGNTISDETETLIYTCKVQCNKNDWSAWSALLMRSTVLDDSDLEIQMRASVSKSEIGLKLTEQPSADPSPLLGFEIVAATQLLLDWFDDRSDCLLRDDVLMSIAKALSTVAALRLRALSESQAAAGSYTDSRRVQDKASGSADVLKSVDQILSGLLSRSEQHVLARLARVVRSASVQGLETSLAASDYISLRLAVACVQLQKRCDNIVINRSLSSSFLSDVTSFSEGKYDGSEIMSLSIVLLARDVLNLLAVQDWQAPVRATKGLLAAVVPPE